MRRSLLYTLLRLGRVPKAARSALEGEGVVLLDEGLRGSVTLESFRAPGRYHSSKGSVFAGSLVLTRARFAAFAFSRPIVNVPLADDRLEALQVSAPEPGLLRIELDVSRFHDGWSGTVTCRFRTAHAEEIVERLAKDGRAA